MKERKEGKRKEGEKGKKTRQNPNTGCRPSTVQPSFAVP